MNSAQRRSSSESAPPLAGSRPRRRSFSHARSAPVTCSRRLHAGPRAEFAELAQRPPITFAGRSDKVVVPRARGPEALLRLARRREEFFAVPERNDFVRAPVHHQQWTANAIDLAQILIRIEWQQS